MLELAKKNTQKHPFHLVDPSPWLLVSGPLSACIYLCSIKFQSDIERKA